MEAVLKVQKLSDTAYNINLKKKEGDLLDFLKLEKVIRDEFKVYEVPSKSLEELLK